MTETIPTLCGSVAGKPSPLGVKLHDAGYQAAKINYKYIAIGTQQIESVLQSIKNLGFRGLGISMPFKQEIIAYLDEVSPDVDTIGACNTIVNRDGRLIGYNTDWEGAINALKEIGGLKVPSATIIGCGGVARAIAYGLKKNNVKVYIAARSEEERKKLVYELDLNGDSSLHDQGQYNTPLIINATPWIDMVNHPVSLSSHSNGAFLLDVVFQQKITPLMIDAENKGWKVAPGWRMLLFQALRQFELYTGIKPPIVEMEQVLFDALS